MKTKRPNLRLAILLMMLGIAGCATPQPLQEGSTTEAPNPIQVSLAKLTHTVRFRAGRNQPDASEIAGLNQFLQNSDIASGDAILIERNAAAGQSGDRFEDKRVATLTASLLRAGLRPNVAFAATVPVGEMVLTIDRYVASAPNCPNWSKAPGNDFANTMHSDFGCATAANLAAMVADPHDFLVGRTMGPAVGDPAIAGMNRYRTGKVSPLSSEKAGPSETSTTSPTEGATQ